MPNRKMIFNIDWWKLACQKSPDAIAFVSIENRFLFCNHSWCKLVGYSESELKEKTWHDITLLEDIGFDQSEVKSIIDSSKEEYYVEKTYLKKDGSRIYVKLYVHRFPEVGDHEGYIVFAKRVSDENYEDLKSSFLDLQQTVQLLKQNSLSSEILTDQMKIIEEKINQNKEIAKMAIERNNINIGDKFGDNSNKAGRDNISGLNINSIAMIALFIIFMVLIFFGMGGAIIYLLLNK